MAESERSTDAPGVTHVAIRVADPADAAAIATVHVRSWQAAYRGLMPDHALATLSIAERERWWARLLSDPPPRTALLVATASSASVVGFCGAGPSLDPAATGDDGQLYTIYLLRRYWRRGIGSKLHTAALHRLAGLGFRRAELWVLETNTRAIEFYRRVGWRADGTRQVDRGPGGIELPEVSEPRVHTQAHRSRPHPVSQPLLAPPWGANSRRHNGASWD